MNSSYDPVMLLLGIFTRELKTYVPHKITDVNAQRGIAQNSSTFPTPSSEER
jgi:hypothetical protein